jgi:O-antigen/teichoic acid export membrane protein
MFGFLNVFFMVRILPQHDIGIWVVFTSVAAILEMIRAGFIRNPFITFFSSAKDGDKNAVIAVSFALHCLLALVITILLAALARPLAGFWGESELENLFYLYAINNFLFIPYLHFEYLMSARMQNRAIFITNFVRLSILFGYIFIHYIVQAQTSILHLAMVQLLATLIGTVVAYPFVKDVIRQQPVFRRKLFTELFHFGKFTIGTNVSSMLIRNTDTWMIGRMISMAGVAIYNPALRLANIFEVPTLAISNLIFPRIGNKMKMEGKRGIRDLYIKSVSLMLAITIPMVTPLLLFPDFFIALIFGSEYLAASPILQVTIFYALIVPFNRQFGTVMDGLKKPRFNFYLLLIAAVVNGILNYFFILRFGLIGSAYATLLSYIFLFIVNQVILYRIFNISPFKVLWEVGEWYRMVIAFCAAKLCCWQWR